MTTTSAAADYVDTACPDNEPWAFECYVDHLFNNLMDNGYAKNTKSNRYIKQAVAKFNDFRKSVAVCFYIHKKDIADDTKHQLDLYIQNCKNENEANHKLNGLFVEVIALIYKEAEPQILSGSEFEDIQWVKKAINEIRTRVSKKWRLV